MAENYGEMKSEQTLHSHHVFLLPFKWSSGEKLCTEQEFKGLSQYLISSGDWQSRDFDLNTVARYNEFHYFYDYVREVIYDLPQDVKAGGKDPLKLIRHFDFTKAEGGSFWIQTPLPYSERPDEEKGNTGRYNKDLRKTYILRIDSVLLHLYHTGVGVLSFHLLNHSDQQSAPEDILYINQYGRRVFPPFYRIPDKLVGTQSAHDYKLFEGVLGRPHGGEIAYEVGISFADGDSAVERWPEHPEWMRMPGHGFHFRLAKHIQPFLGHIQSAGFELYSILDDRMFTVSWYGNQEMVDALTPTFRSGNVQNYLLRKDDWWYKYVFVDGNFVTAQNENLRQALTEKASYLRWSNYSTFYGVTDYSFVLLTQPLVQLKGAGVAFLLTHLQTIYFRLAELVLVQRACVQAFSDEVTHVSRLNIPPDDDPAFERKVKELSNQSSELNKRYIRFINRIYFREVTAQVQGIELYDLLQQQCRLPESVKNLNNEINELHAYVRQETSRLLLAKEQSRTQILTALGAIFVTPGIVIATYDLGFLSDCLDKDLAGSSLIATVFMAALAGYLTYLALTTNKNKWRWIIGGVFIIILLLPLLATTSMGCT